MSTSTIPPKLVSYSDSKQIRSFIRGQACGTISPIPTSALLSDLPSRTIIITGSNSSLGLEAAKQLYTLGVGRLVLACRSVQRGEEARRTILNGVKKPTNSSSTQKSEQTIDVYELDMSSTTSIVAFSQRVKELDRIDTIVLNAGVDLVSYRKNAPEGYEMTMMVNVIGTFLLATLMVPILRQSSTYNKLSEPPRISIVGSAVHFFAKYELILKAAGSGEGILRYLSDEARWTGKITEDRYYLSKGCVQMLVQHLARLITASGKPPVIVHAVQPGYCRTNLFNESTSFGSRIALRLIGWDAEVGGRALVAGAIGKEGGEKSHGGYMSEGHLREATSWLATEQGKEASAKLWTEIAEIIERAQPGTVSSL